MAKNNNINTRHPNMKIAAQHNGGSMRIAGALVSINKIANDLGQNKFTDIGNFWSCYENLRKAEKAMAQALEAHKALGKALVLPEPRYKEKRKG